MCDRDCHREKLGPFYQPMLAEGIAVLAHLIDLLSVLFICNGFYGIEKAAVNQRSSSLPETVTTFWHKFGFGKCTGAS